MERALDHPLARHPLVRRITGYSAGSVVALLLSQFAFYVAYDLGHSGTAIASACGFVGGAVPNYILNRRWAWRDRRGHSRRNEISLYAAVAVASFFSSWACTNWMANVAWHLTANKHVHGLLVQLAYFGVSAAFFVIKFFIYETVVFKRHPDDKTVEIPLREARSRSLVGSAD